MKKLLEYIARNTEDGSFTLSYNDIAEILEVSVQEVSTNVKTYIDKLMPNLVDYEYDEKAIILYLTSEVVCQYCDNKQCEGCFRRP